MRMCSSEGCIEFAKSRGMCRRHYAAFWRAETAKAPKKFCSVAGCKKPLKARGMCNMHVQRLNKNGTLETKGAPYGESADFLRRLVGHEGDECVLWPYGKASTGYGQTRLNGQAVNAHRAMCVLAHGEPPNAEVEAAHRCGNRSCVNPNHLRWATRSENQMDRVEHGRSNRGGRHGLARLTDAEAQAPVGAG
jgi:hypothetical protein